MNIKQSSLLMPSAGENFFPDKNMVIPSLENMNHIFIDNISFKNREGWYRHRHACIPPHPSSWEKNLPSSRL